MFKHFKIMVVFAMFFSIVQAEVFPPKFDVTNCIWIGGEWVFTVDEVSFENALCNNTTFSAYLNARSNGGYDNKTSSFYQCTELVGRYFKQSFGIRNDLSKDIGETENLQNYNATANGFQPRHMDALPWVDYKNDDGTKDIVRLLPVDSDDAQVGDIIRSNFHVAVVIAIEATELVVIEQNYVDSAQTTYEYRRKVEKNNIFRMNIIGCYKDKWHTNGESRAFLNVFNMYKDKIGAPFDNGGGAYVHRWENIFLKGVWVQDLFQPDLTKAPFGDDGKTAIIYNTSLKKAFLVHDGFWGDYKIYHGYCNLGAPRTEEYDVSTSQGVKIKQDFEYKWLEWNGSEIVWHDYSGNVVKKPVISFLSAQRASYDIYSNGVHIGKTPFEKPFYEKGFYSFELKSSSGDRVIDIDLGSTDTTLNLDNLSVLPYKLNKVVVCEKVEEGSIEYSKTPVNAKNQFNQGEKVIGFFEFQNVTKSNVCKVDIYHNGVYSWTYGGTFWNDVKSPWGYMYLLPEQINTLPGTYTFKAFISYSQNSKSYQLIDSISCTILEDPTIPAYALTKVLTCGGVGDGSVANSKIPVGTKSLFDIGEKVIGFFELQNITKPNVCKVDIYHNGVYSWTYGGTFWNDVKSPWGYIYLLPEQSSAQSGTYTFKAYVSLTQNPKSYQLIDSVSCTVDGVAKTESLVGENKFRFKYNKSRIEIYSPYSYSIQLYDLKGKMLLNKYIAQKGKENIDLKYAQGVYFVKLKFKDCKVKDFMYVINF